jgi:lipopolysaccharide/colanic/teichoic acid biosynthesis glycosyltransferase
MKGIVIEEGIEFFEHLTGRLRVESLRPSYFIFSNGFRKSKPTMWGKRVIEFSLSLFALIVLLPVILIISISIKLDSKGPLLYKQERVGENGKRFNLMKFRSMVEMPKRMGLSGLV